MKRFMFLLFTVCSILLTYGQNPPSINSKITYVENDEFLLLRGYVENASQLYIEGLSYTFLALKKSLNNDYTSDRNDGKFNLQPNEVLSVSQLNISLKDDEELKVYLFIRNEEKLLSKDSLHLVPKRFEELKRKKIEEKNFVLKGLVVDELLTKFGKDFHDSFYQQYRLSGVLYPFIITLKERPFFGSSSVITVLVDENKIYEFFVSRTNDEFIENAVRTTLVNLNRYANQRKNLQGNNVKY